MRQRDKRKKDGEKEARAQNMRGSKSETTSTTKLEKRIPLLPVGLGELGHLFLGDIPESNTIRPLEVRLALH